MLKMEDDNPKQQLIQFFKNVLLVVAFLQFKLSIKLCVYRCPEHYNSLGIKTSIAS